MKKYVLCLIAALSSGWLFANHWTPETANVEDNMTFTSIIFIDDVEQRSASLEVGVFCGEQCRGSQKASLFQPTHRYLVQLTIFGVSGEQFTFKLYDHDTQQELDLNSPEAITFNGDGYGSLANPYELHFTSQDPGPGPEPDEVVVTLNPGWNWISYLLKTATPTAEALVNLTPTEGDLLKGMAGSLLFQNSSWQGNLEQMVPGVGYMYYNNSNEVKTFTYPSNTGNQP